jgi:hypothetical protein
MECEVLRKQHGIPDKHHQLVNNGRTCCVSSKLKNVMPSMKRGHKLTRIQLNFFSIIEKGSFPK